MNAIVLRLSGFRHFMDNTKKIQTALVCVTTAAILIRLLYAIPGIMNPEPGHADRFRHLSRPRPFPAS